MLEKAPEGAKVPRVNEIILFVLLTSSIKAIRVMQLDCLSTIVRYHRMKVSQYTNCPYISPSFIGRLLIIIIIIIIIVIIIEHVFPVAQSFPC